MKRLPRIGVVLGVLVTVAASAAACADTSRTTSTTKDTATAPDTSVATDADTAADADGAAAVTPPPKAAAAPIVRTATTPRPPVSGPLFVVASVTDGDTIRLRGGARVRLVQIDTPETYGRAECGGAAASRALTQQIPVGTRVRLALEPTSDRVDRYGRLLRYVYLGPRNLNVWMVANGHAAPYFYDGQRGRFAAQLDRSASKARAARLGMWGACPNAVLDAYRGVATGPANPAQPTGGAAGAAAGAAAGVRQLRVAPAGGPDLDCSDFTGPVRVTPGDPHRLDADGDGIGCNG